VSIAGIFSRANAEALLASAGLSEIDIEYVLDAADDLRPGYVDPNLQVHGDDDTAEAYMIRWNHRPPMVDNHRKLGHLL
jgi:hypothetical protein